MSTRPYQENPPGPADLVVLSYDLTHLAVDLLDTYRAFVAGEIEGPLERVRPQ